MDPIIILIYLTAGAVACALIEPPESMLDYALFLLLWPFVFLTGVIKMLWNVVLVKLP